MATTKPSPKKKGMRSRTPWATKLRPDLAPQVITDMRTGGTMLIPTPMLVAAEIRKARRGKLITAVEIRERLAEAHHADVTCPMTTGIFINIVAGATEDDRAAGRKLLAPWWRVVDAKGRISEKTPPGPELQARLLRDEGHTVSQVGRHRVVDA